MRILPVPIDRQRGGFDLDNRTVEPNAPRFPPLIARAPIKRSAPFQYVVLIVRMVELCAGLSDKIG